VSFYDAIRFANWLHNEQPAGAQEPATTEDGAYTITELGIANSSVARNPTATVFLTSEDEWYKAAYYDAVSQAYFAFPAGSDTQTTCAAPGATANTANCDFAVGAPSSGGSYSASPSPAGTFDQGGNLEEWNEAVIIGTLRGVRGGDFGEPSFILDAQLQGSQRPTAAFGILGFRVASVPEPRTGLLRLIALLSLAAASRLHRSLRTA